MGGGGGFPFGAFASMGGPGVSFRTQPASSSSHSQPQQKAPPVNHALNVTLEELYTGAIKRVRITKKLLDPSGKSTSAAIEKEIPVKQGKLIYWNSLYFSANVIFCVGWKNGTKITFEREGDESPGVIPADIIFTLQTKPHARFTRQEDDLYYTCRISLHDILSGISYFMNT